MLNHHKISELLSEFWGYSERSLTGTGTLVSSIQSSTHLGTVSSSSRKVYLYCYIGTSNGWGLIAGTFRSDGCSPLGCTWDAPACIEEGGAGKMM